MDIFVLIWKENRIVFFLELFTENITEMSCFFEIVLEDHDPILSFLNINVGQFNLRLIIQVTRIQLF